ncbi:putative ankyrin repeat protein [Cladobotryum mycophilum]|uniref:Ankyrin repeat protein n=1 Tax=Cladobotryum mycophilum TaxID=491253 RepID=A0ABR0T1F7_9HYPO
MEISQQIISGEARVHNGDRFYKYVSTETMTTNEHDVRAEPNNKCLEDPAQVNQLCMALLNLAWRDELDKVRERIKAEFDRRVWGPGYLGFPKSFRYTFKKLIRRLGRAWSARGPPPHLRRSYLKLFQAIIAGDCETIEKLIKDRFSRFRAESTMPKFVQVTALFLAIGFSQLEPLRLLLKRGVDTNGKGPENCTILHRAVFRNILEIVRDVIGVMPNIDVKDDKGQTPLSANLDAKHREVLLLLSENKADPDQAGLDGIPILCQAAKDGLADNIQLLLELKASHSIKGKFGRAPLHEAADSGHLECVKVLIDAGADINAISDPGETGDAGQTPLDMAIRKKRHDIVQLLREKDPQKVEKEAERGRSVPPLHVVDPFPISDIIFVTVKEFSRRFARGPFPDFNDGFFGGWGNQTPFTTRGL